MSKIQGFEERVKQAFSPTPHQAESVSRPLISILSEPVDLLHCDSVKTVAAFKALSGRWTSIRARRGKPASSRNYSVRTGPLAISASGTGLGSSLYLFEGDKLISEVSTDSEGKATFQLPSTKPTTGNYTVSMTPELLPINTPLQDVFNFTVWMLTCYVRNKTDRWWRFVGRSFFDSLPRSFWSKPLYTIGLGAPTGIQKFYDIVPVFGDQSATLEYGVSAFCNTVNPNPSAEECAKARENTWWEFKIEATNGSQTKSVKGDLNLDHHLRVTLTTNDISAEVIKAS